MPHHAARLPFGRPVRSCKTCSGQRVTPERCSRALCRPGRYLGACHTLASSHRGCGRWGKCRLREPGRFDESVCQSDGGLATSTARAPPLELQIAVRGHRRLMADSGQRRLQICRRKPATRRHDVAEISSTARKTACGRPPEVTNACFVDAKRERTGPGHRAALEQTDGRQWVGTTRSPIAGGVVGPARTPSHSPGSAVPRIAAVQAGAAGSAERRLDGDHRDREYMLPPK